VFLGDVGNEMSCCWMGVAICVAELVPRHF
jgi:hypothetical protein